MSHSRRNPSSVRIGFTLVELLVVISIIALLIAILLPSLRRAKRQAQATVCASHLRNLGQGLQMYAGEFDGHIPRDISGLVGDVPFAVPLLWMLSYEVDQNSSFVRAFAKIETLQCPSFPQDNRDASGKRLLEQPLDFVVNGFPKRYVADPVSDALNANPDPKAFWIADTPLADPPEKLSEIRNATGIIYSTEAHRALPSDQPSNWRASWGPWAFPYHDVWRGAHLPRGVNPRIANDMRHPAGINSVFFDGHVEVKKPESMIETDFYFPN